MLVRHFTDGQDIDAILLVRERELRTGRDGSALLRLVLGDRSGSVVAVSRLEAGGPLEAVACDGAEPVTPIAGDEDASPALCAVGAPVHVRGRFEVHPRHGAQIAVAALRAARPGDVDWEALLDGPPRAADQMEADLRQLVATVQNRHLRALLDAVLGPESPTWPAFRDAPAAKRYHQAYRHGLLEHCLGVAQAVSAISATFPGIDRDVAVCGALLHDIGKLDAYTADPLAIEMTDAGKLQGEIALGYYRVRRLIEDLPGFPADLAAAVLHIILSHHGQLAHGSPVVPCTREATLVHMIDNLGGRLGSFDRLEKELADGSRWSGYDRALGGGAYFAGRAAA
jgi:3'-5' exoribonuclease